LKKETSYIVVGNVISTTTVENSMEAPQRTKNRTAISKIPLLGIF
jgi:hypothetical protein